MEIEEIRALLTVLETGSMAAAAARLGIPRTTLRRRLDQLEARLGVPLLERDHKGTALTPAGDVVVARGRLLVDDADDMVRAVGQEIGSADAMVRVVLPAGLLPESALSAFAMGRARFPGLRWDLRFEDGWDAASIRRADLAAVIAQRPPEGPWRSFALLRLRWWILASEAYLETRGTPQSVGDLDQHDVICWIPRPGDPAVIPLADGTTRPIDNPLLASTHVHFLREAAAAGQGLCVVPDALLPVRTTFDVPLRPVLEDTVRGELALWAMLPEKRAEHRRVRALVELVRSFAESLPS